VAYRYYKLEKGVIQEAFREFYKYTSSEGLVDIPSRGCKSLYKEVQVRPVISDVYKWRLDR